MQIFSPQVSQFRMASISILSALLFVTLPISRASAVEASASPISAIKIPLIDWQPWSDEAFQKADREKKLVILDLEAVWCHWCHVMDEKTYHDSAVMNEIQAHYIAIRVDQDSRPDISNRFEDYGWPATILFDGKGRVLARRSGFIEPNDTLKMLKAFAADPAPGPSASDDVAITYAEAGVLNSKLTSAGDKVIKDNYDFKLGGWKASHKFLDTHLADYWLRESLKGSKPVTRNLEKALDTQLQIQDPAWGGFYQYSAEGDWRHPHFEKLIAIQTENLRVYAEASMDSALSPKSRRQYLEVAQRTKNYIDTFLKSPNSTYYVSQDADLIQGQHAGDYFSLGDKARRAKGIPRVDKHVYTRENAWVINAMLTLAAVDGDAKAIQEAESTTEWLIKNRKNGALFKHDEKDLAGPYLGDNSAMLEALIKLHSLTGDRRWLREAIQLAHATLKEFPQSNEKPGLLTTKDSKSLPQFEENFRLASSLNLLSHYAGQNEFEAAAKQIFRFLSSSQFEGGMYATSAILVLDNELRTPPLHIVVSGSKLDPKARELFETAIKFPSIYKMTEWWDSKEGPLLNSDSSYPTLSRSAAFVCGEHRCSFPAFESKDIALRVKQLSK